MTDLQPYFASSEIASPSTTTATEAVGSTETKLENGGLAGCTNAASISPDSTSFVLKKPRANSKLILQNMEEVLHSVKKKHRQKHRRKKEEKKKLAQMEAEAAAVSVGNITVAQDKHSTVGSKNKHRDKKPLQEKTAQENGLNNVKTKKKERKSPLKGVASNVSILKHFPRTPKKDEADCVETEDAANDQDVIVQVESPPLATLKEKVASKPTNAFEVMMNARNKTIGSNTPGKEAPATPPLTEDTKSATKANVKRKLVLQEWAEKKSATKRKLDEEERALYVEQQLEQRAKRLKKMLVSGGSADCSPNANVTTTDKSEKPKENANRRSKQKIEKTIMSHEKSDTKMKRTRGRPRRKRRLSSSDSVASLDNCTPDPETEEFLAKLASPTKKRDSLLGYFVKKESPKEISAKTEQLETTKAKDTKANEDVDVETPKRRPRRSAASEKRSVAYSVTDLAVVESPAPTLNVATAADNTAMNTPSGRPKRNCAGKARYDYDLQESPTKQVANIDKETKLNKSVVANETEAELIIDLDDSNSNLDLSQQTPKKLAPLFVRGRTMPKPSPDPVALKARRDFLQSGVPEKIRLEIAKQQQYQHNYEEALELFPKITHVHQWSDSEIKQMHRRIKISYKLRAIEANEIEIESTIKQKLVNERMRCSIGSITSCTQLNFQMFTKTALALSRPLQPLVMPTVANKRNIIKTWKTEFERFPTYKCYNQMREKYRYFSAIDSAQDTEQVGESFVVTRRTRRSFETQKKFDPEAEEVCPPPTAPNGELLFSEKYKPMLFEQVLVNLTPVTQLREFLANWSNGGAGSARNSQPTLDDSIDFMNESSLSQNAPACNSVVLLGPGSSGKTNAVFALANEMNFNVLEINAGMRRTGKKLIQELQEATQSHQIRKESPVNVQHGGKAQSNLLKMSLNGLKSKKQSSTPSQNNDADSSNGVGSSTSELSQSARKCLILIEDADIVFEQTDAGFVDAIYTLAASSKRPVIAVASNPNCSHLQRLMNQNTIKFTAPNVLNISKFLAVLSLIENCPINLDDLISLYLYNRKNLRKTLLELQFFIQSGGDRQCYAVKEQTPTKNAAAHFFASPSKRRFSIDPSIALLAPGENDEKLDKDAQQNNTRIRDSTAPLYTHRTLFEYYTVGQNEKCRIPFPVDFRLVCINLNDIFKASKKLKVNAESKVDKVTVTATKRKSRSPKKAWLSSATNNNTAKQSLNASSRTSLDALCDFYENASIATLLGTRDDEHFSYTALAHTPNYADRLVPHLTEHIAHHLVEQAIVVNLAADLCPYNLFDTPKDKQSLCDNLGYLAMRTNRSRALDFEPALRSICRSEKHRATLERRSTRFYHYLRNCSVNMCNFSTEHFDNACDTLHEPAHNELMKLSDSIRRT